MDARRMEAVAPCAQADGFARGAVEGLRKTPKELS